MLALHARGQLVRNAASDNPERLVPQGDWKELNFVFKGVHCTALHARGTRAARALNAHFNLLVGHAFTLRVRLPLPPPPFALSQAHGTRGLWSCCPPPLR